LALKVFNRRITWKQFERYWFFLSLIMVIGSLSYSKYGLSMGQMMLAGGWIVERFDRNKWLSQMAGLTAGKRSLRFIPLSFGLLFSGIFSGFRQFFRNRPALIFSSIFLIHILGLVFTTDFSYALKDLRTKLPILLLPLLLATSESIDRKTFYRYMLFFILIVAVRSGYNAWKITGDRFLDIRDVSQNISHIIFGLEIVMAIYTTAFFIFRRNLLRAWQRWLLLPVIGWLLAYLILSRSFTGLSVLLFSLLILIMVMTFRTGIRCLKMALAAGFILIACGMFLYLRSVVRDYYQVNPVDFSNLETTTSRGNPYIHNPYSTQTENGNYVWIYIQWDEMRNAWNQRSAIPFDSLGRKNETVAYTVVRYLSSKGWRKDADAIERLTLQEVAAIENGVANQIFLEKFSIRGRIYEFLWGFDNYRETGNPTGSTVMQRLEFWKASIGIIRGAWLTGVGTGDMNTAFRDQYETMQTMLSTDQRWRSHNQFLSIFIGFGIFGLVWFLVAIFYPPVRLRRMNDYFFLTFLIIILLSMLTGDTIESQTGVSFFAIFYSLFLFAREGKDEILITRNT